MAAAGNAQKTSARFWSRGPVTAIGESLAVPIWFRVDQIAVQPQVERHVSRLLRYLFSALGDGRSVDMGVGFLIRHATPSPTFSRRVKTPQTPKVFALACIHPYISASQIGFRPCTFTIPIPSTPAQENLMQTNTSFLSPVRTGVAVAVISFN